MWDAMVIGDYVFKRDFTLTYRDATIAICAADFASKEVCMMFMQGWFMPDEYSEDDFSEHFITKVRLYFS